jgi:PEP-CTERM motif
MKKLILAAFALTAAVSVFAQGTVEINNRILNPAGPSQTTHIWGPSATAPGLSLIGLGSNDTPSGTTAFGSASSMALIGSGGSVGQYGRTTTLAQLIGATGSGQLESSLRPVGQTTTFRSGSSLGGVAGFTDTLSGSPGIGQDAAFATFELVAWDNSTGLYSTWTQASVAWLAGTIAAGHTTAFTVSALGGLANPSPFLTDMGQNLTSFNLYFNVIPEPSTFALAGMGAAALLIFRRRK